MTWAIGQAGRLGQARRAAGRGEGSPLPLRAAVSVDASHHPSGLVAQSAQAGCCIDDQVTARRDAYLWFESLQSMCKYCTYSRQTGNIVRRTDT